MLTGHRAAERDALVEDLLERGLRCLARLLVVGRRDDQRVQVAVAGVGDGRDLHAVLGRDLVDRLQHRRHLRPRHADVLGEDRTEAFQCGVGQLARREQRLRLGRIGAGLGPDRAGRGEGAGDRCRLGVARGAGGVDLREQQRLEGRVEAEVLPVLDGLQAVLVEQLEDGRHQPLSGARGHGLPGVHQVVERADDGARWLRARRPQPQGHLGDDAERPLGPDEQAGQVEPAHALRRTPTEAHRRAVRAARSADHGLEPEDVVAGDAVLEAAQAAGIGRDVAADGRPRRARRVRRVPESFGGDGGLEVVVDDARLDDDDLVVGVDLEDPVQAGDVEDQAAVGGVRAAGQSGARAARDDRARRGRRRPRPPATPPRAC